MMNLSRGSSKKKKNLVAVRTRTVVAFMCCFSTLASLFVLSPPIMDVPVPSHPTSLKESFMGYRPSTLSDKKTDDMTELCFVTSVYGSSAVTSDKPLDVTNLQRKTFPESKFYIFTNMEDLNAPGWIKVIRKFDYKRFITMSRWPKFMAWKEPMIQSCRVVFYMDGYVTPNPLNKDDILRIARDIENSDVGMAQNPASTKKRTENHTLVDELKYIIRTEKDIFPNINATAQWLREQPDFAERNRCQVYDNCLIGYDPRNQVFQSATNYFWNQYSSEKYTWRDQPFWCFTLNKLGVKPIFMGGSRHDYFNVHNTNKAPGKHKYDTSHENNANETPKEEPEPEKKESVKEKRKRKKMLEKLSNQLDVYQTA